MLDDGPLSDPACTRCELHRTAKSVCVLGDGDLFSTLLVVGIAPGHSEDEARKVFHGKSGRLLRSIMAEQGLVPYITNLVGCRPPDNRDPTAEEIRACRVYLERVVARMVNLKVVVALGSPAMKAFDVPGSVVKLAGVPRPAFAFGKHLTVVPVMHPAGLMRRPAYYSTWESHWHAIRQIVHPPEKTLADTIGAVLLPSGLQGRGWRTL